ncbi:MAG: ABC transporter substrate-binding protein [Propionibacteriaceae bacterium]|jgi:peptide/nickel transport system substrate-binding protein|nr:ABC transporter substrate-binding protein [Propionibacteriaceae bacterium]
MAFKKTAIGFLAVAVTAALSLAGCAKTEESKMIVVGTSDKIVALDPAGAFDHGSLTVEIQVYSFLYGFVPGFDTPQPDAAEVCEYVEPTVFECKIREGLKFANGHDLTASDVKFTYDRMVAISDPNGPVDLLDNLDSVDVVDELTVRFNLVAENDQTFLQILATSAGPIVDEEVFPADALISDEDIIAANAFSGPYTITSYAKNEVAEFTPYADYIGAQPKPANDGVTMKTFTDATNLMLSITNGDIDVAYRSLTPTDIESLQANKNVKVWDAPGGEIRYIVFNFDIMPGETVAQKLAIRQAVAASIDRNALSEQVYKGQYLPLCSYVPDSFAGANQAVCDLYGDAPDLEKATAYLADAGVETPVTLPLQYSIEHYGSSSAEEYGLIKKQLEDTGLFTVELQSAEWGAYTKEYNRDGYQVFQLGWFPDYPDGDNYLSPFFRNGGFFNNHFSNAEVNTLLTAQNTEADPAARAALLGDIQDILAQYLPTLPLLQGSQWAFSRTNITGIQLGVDENLHFNTIAKS